MSLNGSLPQGWMWTTLGAVADVNPRLSTLVLPDTTPVSFVPMAAVEAETGRIEVSEQRPIAEVKRGYTSFQDGDVLFAKITPCMENGKSAVAHSLVSGLGFGSTEFHILRPTTVVDSHYLYHYIAQRSFRQDARAHMTGTAGQLRVPAVYMKDAPLPLPPLAEQRRIVAAIEEQFTRLDAGVAALKSARVRLKRYRAAVLKAAVSGELTAAWRPENPSVEPAPVLLARILAERRERWAADLRAKGKEPAKGQYKEPAAPDTAGLPEVPEGWCWAMVDAVLHTIEAGKNFACEERPPRENEVGVVKVSAVTWGEFDEQESKTCTDASRIEPRFFIRAGDFLFSRANTISLVGAVVIAKSTDKRLMLSDKILRLRFNLVPQEWILLVLRSRWGRDEIERLATGNQESMRNIGQDRIRRIRVPLPPLAEQERIVAEVERRLSVIATLEGVVAANVRRAERLRQSILREAFAGRLAAQDPNDEPASALLERIRWEREERDAATGGGDARARQASLWAEPGAEPKPRRRVPYRV